jgi:hypothetical protein
VSNTAAATASATSTATVNGILSVTNQADWFSITAAAGSATVAVAVTAPFGQGVTRANLNAIAAVYDASGAVLTFLNPSGLDIPAAQVTFPSGGTYYVSVSGTGDATPATSGYSSYASLGFYALTVTYPAVTAEPPKPVDCVGSWSSYGDCDASCSQVSTYGITQTAANGGAECPTAAGATRSQTCTGGACVKPAVDCVGAWSDWTECGINCSQTSTYVITQPAENGGAECPTQNGWVKRQPCQGGGCKPAPVDTGMVVTGINVTREVTTIQVPVNNKTGRGATQPRQLYWCRSVVTIRTTAGAPLAKARVSGTWSAPDNAAFTAFAAPLDTRASGQAVFRSKSSRVEGSGTACTFTVTNVEFTGRTLDLTNSVVTSSYSWKQLHD